MTTPVSKLPRTGQSPAGTSERASKGASNEEFAGSTAAAVAAPAPAWDPFEVWRTRVFQTPAKRYNKDRGNT
ncbi:MAG: hypothetical protein ABI885_04060 [Gammaproteobacteria bacterium]